MIYLLTKNIIYWAAHHFQGPKLGTGWATKKQEPIQWKGHLATHLHLKSKHTLECGSEPIKTNRALFQHSCHMCWSLKPSKNNAHWKQITWLSCFALSKNYLENCEQESNFFHTEYVRSDEQITDTRLLITNLEHSATYPQPQDKIYHAYNVCCSKHYYFQGKRWGNNASIFWMLQLFNKIFNELYYV